MADPTDRDAERLDAWLDGDRYDGGDLSAFAEDVIRETGLSSQPDSLSREQRERIRARVLGGAPQPKEARTDMTAHAFAPNGAEPAPTAIPIQIREPERPPSKLSILMTAALVALIAVAGLALARGSIDLPGGGDDPAPTGMPALAYSPVASPSAEPDCSRDQWVSVFDGEVPGILKDTAHATLDDGTLTWRCGGESEELATDVRHASGVFLPGVIALVTEDDEVRLINIASGTSVDLDGDLLLNEDGKLDVQNQFVWSGGPEPWVIVPANADDTDWRIIDVRSMESLLLSDELGDVLPRPFTPSFGQITGTDVAVIRWYEPLPNLPGTPQAGGVNGVPPLGSGALVLPHSLENRRWIQVYDWNALDSRMSYSQVFSVSQDGTLLAYASQEDGQTTVRVEDAVSGDRVADVPVDALGHGTHFMLAGSDDRLVTSSGDSVTVYNLPGGDIVAEQTADPTVLAFYPTVDPDTVLAARGTKSVVPIDARDGTVGEPWQYVPNIVAQLFGTYELPENIVRVVSDELGGTPATIQLVDPATGSVVLASQPVDAHPLQIVSFNTYLRNGGELAVVPIGYNRAVVLNAATDETWQIAAPVDDDRLWHFYPSLDGNYVTAYPEPPVGTTGVDEGDAWTAPLAPVAEWVPFEAAGEETSMLVPGTPTG